MSLVDSMGKFDFNTIGVDNFDEHIKQSIPNYDVLINSISSMSQYFFCENKRVYDLGCSTGKLLKSLNTNCDKVGYDNSDLCPNEKGFYKVDLNGKFEVLDACVVYSIFTMQFIDPTRRVAYLQTIFDGLIGGGCLFICEKVYQQRGRLQEIMSFSHYDYKLNHFSSDEIISKERDLRHIMKPTNEGSLEYMLDCVGFKTVSVFWQMFNFKGIIAIKDE